MTLHDFSYTIWDTLYNTAMFGGDSTHTECQTANQQKKKPLDLLYGNIKLDP